MKYCIKCGEKVNDDAQFCPGCGAKIPEGTEEKKQSYDGQQEQYTYQSAGGPDIFTQKMCARIRLWECFRISESWC